MYADMKRTEIRDSLKKLITQYIEECTNCDKISDDFYNLLKHNFMAKFVFYNKEEKTIEIGINEGSEPTTYPKIKVFSFPVTKSTEWLDKSFKSNRTDLEFYGKLLNRGDILSASELTLI